MMMLMNRMLVVFLFLMLSELCCQGDIGSLTAEVSFALLGKMEHGVHWESCCLTRQSRKPSAKGEKRPSHGVSGSGAVLYVTVF